MPDPFTDPTIPSLPGADPLPRVDPSSSEWPRHHSFEEEAEVFVEGAGEAIEDMSELSRDMLAAQQRAIAMRVAGGVIVTAIIGATIYGVARSRSDR